MKKRYIVLTLLLLVIAVGIFRMRNFIRFVIVQQHRPVEVKLDHLEYQDEGAFEVYIYSANRTWSSRRVSWINTMFNDELILFKNPGNFYAFRECDGGTHGK